MSVDPRRLQVVFLTALAGSEDDRAVVLDRECGDDDDLRAEVSALLQVHDLPDNALDTPALAGAATEAGYDETSVPAGREPRFDRQSWVGPQTVLAGRYQLTEQIGEGGMGVVYRAEQTAPVRRTVAIKLIRAGMNSTAVLARFELERQALAMMDHPNIAKVLDAGEVGNRPETSARDARPFFVMELIEGEPITKYCQRERLSIRDRLELFIPVCRAVQHAHQKGVIHRDLKPSNLIVVKRDGKAVPVVIDFGIAKSTGASLDTLVVESSPGLFLGSLDYMAPEQGTCEPSQVDTRTDVYALGAILYELLCGDVPHGRDRLRKAPVFEVARIMRDEEPPPPSVRAVQDVAAAAAAGIPELARLGGKLRGELDWIVTTCLEKDADRRYPSAGALADDLTRYLHDEPVAAGPPSVRYRLRKLARRHRGAVLAVSALVLALIGGTIGTAWGLVQAKNAEKTAIYERDQKTLALAAEAAQRKEAEAQRTRAGEEAATALSVLQFVQNDLLRQADPNWQVFLTQDAEPNLTVRAALDRSSATVERRFRDKPLAEAAIRRTMGIAYDGLGDIAKAVYHLNRSVELFVKHVGPDDERTISAQFNLAAAYRKTLKVADSIPLFEKVYNWRRAHLGANHWDTITTANCLSFVYIGVGRLDDAEELLSEVADHQRHLGQDTYVSLATLNAAAYLQAKRGHIDEAIQQLEELIQRWDTAFGPETPYKFDPLNNLGQLYQRVGRFDDAIHVFKDALDRGQQTWPAEHPKLIILTDLLVEAYWESGETDDAIKLQEEFRQKLMKRLGPSHLRVQMATSNLARIYAETGDTAKAEELLRKSLELMAPAGSQAALTRGLVQATLARVLYLSGKLDEAESIAREALATMASRRPDDWPVHDLRMQIGLILAKKGQAEDAQQMLTEGRVALEKRKVGLPYPARRCLIEADAVLATLPIQS